MKKQINTGIAAILIFITISLGFTVVWYANTHRALVSVTYNTSSGDTIEVKITDREYEIVPTDSSFDIFKKNDKVLSGVFITDEYFEEFKTFINDEENVLDLDLEIFVNEDNKLVYIVNIEETASSNTSEVYIVERLTNTTSIVCCSDYGINSAEACYDSLQFNKK